MEKTRVLCTDVNRSFVVIYDGQRDGLYISPKTYWASRYLSWERYLSSLDFSTAKIKGELTE